MKSALLLASALACAVTPTIAEARTSRGELHRDLIDVRQEHRDLNRAIRSGNEARIKAERREYRGAKQELREDARVFVRERHR